MIRFTKRLANRSLDGLFLRGMEGLWLRRLRGRVLVLVYHRVAPSSEFSFLSEGGAPTIVPEEFEADIRFLLGLGVRFMTFADLHAGHFPDANEIGVAVTFDDGFRDTYERGLAILGQYGIRGTVFQSTGMLDRGQLLLEHRLYRLLGTPGGRLSLGKLAETLIPGLTEGRVIAELPLALLERVRVEMMMSHLPEGSEDLSDEEDLAERLYPDAALLRSAREAGHDIGSHGHGHLHRRGLDAKEFEAELGRSRDVLGNVLGVEPISFSYPFNAREAGDRELCGRYFSQVATVDSELVGPCFDPLSIPRYTWPGPARNALRQRRWLLTGRI